MLNLSRVLVIAVLFSGAQFLSGCGPHCTTESVCSVLGTGSDLQVCDGDDFQDCNDSNRGKVIACVSSPRIASCTTTGWTFENAAK